MKEATKKMTFNETKTVRELALEIPNSARVFQKLRIDFCCGGQRPLAEACAAAGVEPVTVWRMLEEEAARGESARDFRQATLAELIQHILDTHHVYTREEMGRISLLLAKVTSKHGEAHPELLAAGALFQRLCADLVPHLFKEEQILFPCVLRLEEAARRGAPAPFAPFGTVENPVRMMMSEHDTAGDLLRELRAATREYALPPEACLSFRALYEALEAFEKDLHQHIHLENNLLFPRAVEMEEQAAVTA
jgi:regulator of cell morphogenesis and NO signaling